MRRGFVTIIALLFLILVGMVLTFELQGYHQQMKTFDTLIQHYQTNDRSKKE